MYDAGRLCRHTPILDSIRLMRLYNTGSGLCGGTNLSANTHLDQSLCFCGINSLVGSCTVIPACTVDKQPGVESINSNLVGFLYISRPALKHSAI